MWIFSTKGRGPVLYDNFILIKDTLYLTFIKLKLILNFIKGGEGMMTAMLPEWLVGLEEEDLTFIKRFLLCSGSLKELAQSYGVTYPTVRLRLDRLIQKIRIGEEAAADPFVSLIKRLAVEEKLDFGTAKVLIAAYRRMNGP